MKKAILRNEPQLPFTEKQLKESFSVAKEAQRRAYAPYSKFKVGASLWLQDQGTFIPGCNVENASFGGTVCAERSAILSARSRFGKSKFGHLLIVTPQDPPAPPCAICLQTIAEFCDEDFPITLATPKKILRTYRFKELLPQPFSSFKAPK